jgi:DNA-binding transcriptional ArsR family regulator
MSRHIDQKTAIEALTALAQQTRMEAFKRLVEVFPDEITSGEIARGCKVPHNTMSTHLAILERAGLVVPRRDGRMAFYSAGVDGLRALVSYLMRDCCHGRAEVCAPLVAELTCCLPTKKRGKALADRVGAAPGRGDEVRLSKE